MSGFPRGSTQRHFLRRRAARPSLECLEDRTLLGAQPLPGPLDFSSLNMDPDSFSLSRMLVRFHSDAPEITGPEILPGTEIGPEFALVPGLRAVFLVGEVSLYDALAAYQASSHVAYVSPDFRVYASRFPNDPDFPLQWALHNTGQTGGTPDADLDMPEAWEHGTSTSAIVAVLDTGIDYTHPDLAANIWVNPGEIPGNGIDDDGNGYVDDVHGYDFVNDDPDPMDDHGHGTHVAGVIGAVGNNGIGISGVAWSVRLMALKFLDATGSGYTSDAITALNYAIANGASLSNNSWAGRGFDRALFNAIRSAGNAGHIFVAAAGNDGQNIDRVPVYPAAFDLPNVVTVAATDHDNKLAWFSNYGPRRVDVAAPGVGIYSTTPGNGYDTFSGTSMAAAHVTGLLALMRGQHPGWSSQQLIDQLLGTVDPLPALGGQTAGGGLANGAGATGQPVPDTSGPWVVSLTPLGPSDGQYHRVRVTFNEAVDAVTFSVADVVQFTGPAGLVTPVGVAPVAGTGGRQFDIYFAAQGGEGAYTLTLGPGIFDLATPPNPMNQDRDGVNGELPQDRFTGTFSLGGGSSYVSADEPQTIADLSVTVSTLEVSENLLVGDVNVEVRLDHENTGDLLLFLVSPAGTVVVLSRFRGEGRGFSATRFDDEAGLPIRAGTSPFAGSYQPETPLAALDGQWGRGTWQLWVADWEEGAKGVLNGWGLTITPATHPPPSPPLPAQLSEVSAALAHSTEYYWQYVVNNYRTLLNRRPSSAEVAAWVRELERGVSSDVVFSGFLASPEYYRRHGATPAAWLDAVYRDVLHRAPDVAGKEYWLGLLAAGFSRGSVARQIVGSLENYSQEVRKTYAALLGRRADDDEVAGWVTLRVLGITHEQMLAAFLSSREYFLRRSANAADWLFHAYRDVLHRNADNGGYVNWLMLLEKKL